MRTCISRAGSIAALIVILGSSTAFHFFRQTVAAPDSVDALIENLPQQFGAWTGKENVELDPASRKILQLDRHVRRVYASAEQEMVFLYIGYWKKQSGEYQAAKHSPAVCFPSNGWAISNQNRVVLSLPGKSPGDETVLKINRLTGDKRRDKDVVYYWFFSGAREYADEWRSLIYLTWEKFIHNRSDGGIVEISTALSTSSGHQRTEEEAYKIIERFIRDFYPELTKLTRPN